MEGSELNNMGQSQVIYEHPGYVCDGCDQGPIYGPRFMCSVCKDFDYCATCEERSNHPHPFIKIMHPSQKPKAIFMTIDEKMKDANADIERDVDQKGDHP